MKEPGKRIVSKGAYAARKTFALCLSACVLACSLGIMGQLLILPYSQTLTTQENISCSQEIENGERCMECCTSLTSNDVAFECVVGISFLLITAFLLQRKSHNVWKTVHTMQPLTRANSADLPPPNSLVRASEEPVQEPQAVLLRAAMNSEQTPLEQLVRPAIGTK